MKNEIEKIIKIGQVLSKQRTKETDEFDGMIRLGKQLEDQKNSGFDLWTRLPSYQDACKHHGDYASSHMPCISDILCEATLFISHGLAPTEEQIREAGEMYTCPCGGELHDHEADEAEAG
ncbi:hypothetical protein D3C87_465890 [compost metagenome]